MSMGGRIGGPGGYQQPPYGGGYPAGPGKGRAPFGQPPAQQQPPYGGGFGGYQQPQYGGGYPAGPGKGRAPYGIPSQNAYYDQGRPFRSEPVQPPHPPSSITEAHPEGGARTLQIAPRATPPPPTQTEQVPGRPTRGLAGFGHQAEGFPRGLPIQQDLQNTPPTPPQQDPNFVYQPPSWLGDELAASESTDPVRTLESVAEKRRLERERWSQLGYEGRMHSCPSPKEHIQLANNDWILAGNLKVGDEVATSEKPEKVTRVQRIESSPRCEVFFEDSDSIVTSYSHPYFVNNKGFVEVSDLEKGDQVGDLVVKDKKSFSDGPVISLSVDKAETYMLKGGTKDSPVPALSHNKSPPPPPTYYDPSDPRTMERWKTKRDHTTWVLPGTEAWQKWDERRQRREQSGYIAPEMQSLNGDREPAPPTPTAPTLERTNIFGQTADEAAATGPLGMRPRFYGSPGKGMRPQPYGGGFGGYQQPLYGGGFGGGFGGYQQPFYGGGFGGYPRSPYGGGFGGGVFSQGYGVPRGIGSLLSNYPSYMPPRMPFNPYVR